MVFNQIERFIKKTTTINTIKIIKYVGALQSMTLYGWATFNFNPQNQMLNLFKKWNFNNGKKRAANPPLLHYSLQVSKVNHKSIRFRFRFRLCQIFILAFHPLFRYFQFFPRWWSSLENFTRWIVNLLFLRI